MRRWLERAVVLGVVVTCVVLLSIVGLVFYVVHRSKPSRFKLSATVLKLLSFSIEIESQDDGQRDKLPSRANDIDSVR